MTSPSNYGRGGKRQKRARKSGTVTQTQTSQVESEIIIRSKKDFKTIDTKDMAKLAQYLGITYEKNTRKKDLEKVPKSV